MHLYEKLENIFFQSEDLAYSIGKKLDKQNERLSIIYRSINMENTKCRIENEKT